MVPFPSIFQNYFTVCRIFDNKYVAINYCLFGALQ